MDNLFFLNKIYCKENSHKYTDSPKVDINIFYKKIGINNNISKLMNENIKNNEIRKIQKILRDKQDDILLLYNIIHNEYGINIDEIKIQYEEQIQDFNLLANIFLKTIKFDK